MRAGNLPCCLDDDKRRRDLRAAALNGLDYLEVGCDQTELRVYFLGKAPKWEITPKHLRIEGGARIRDIRVIEVTVERNEHDDADDCMLVKVDRAGDFSTYRLCVVDHEDFDPRYTCLCFNFKAECPSDLDCAPQDDCEKPALPEPALDYLARDYASFRRLILDRLALTMPQWKEGHVPDLGVTLVELLAYEGDHLAYQQDAVATEAYLDTARLRTSVRRHARLVDYALHEGCNARAWVALTVAVSERKLDPKDFYFVTDLPGLPGRMIREEDLPRAESPAYLVFETQQQVTLYEAHNSIDLYTWGESECCLPQGATSATLVGELRLKPLDVIVFEEVYGPRTGVAGDADRSHRHAVRLTKVTHTQDPLTRQPLVDVEWAAEDALPFTLCISAVGPPPECKLKSGITIARGNVVLVDHGRSVTDDPCEVPVGEIEERCDDDCALAEVERRAGPFRPALSRSDLTSSEELIRTAASAQLKQDARRASPRVILTGTLDDIESAWYSRPSLLSSNADDRHCVVEMDDERRAWLRFGDGDCGRAVQAGEKFVPRYRVGNGSIGNVGAEVITRIVFRNNFPEGAGLTARNPLPAAGGTDPESVPEAKLRAPFTFRTRLERAITASDYAAIVMRDFPVHVQRAAAVIRWSGISPEVLVAVDARGRAQPDEALLRRIRKALHRYRRIGHDIDVVAARVVPLKLDLHVCVAPGHLKGHVKAALLRALGNRKSGFFHPDQLSFGEGIFVSRIVSAAQAMEGVDSVVVTALERYGEGPAGELESGVLPLGAMEVARLDNDPSFPEHGQLTLILDGGR